MESGGWEGMMGLGRVQKMAKYDKSILYKIIKELIKIRKSSNNERKLQN